MATELELELTTCQSCGIKGPKTRFCLNCGNKKLLNTEDIALENVVEEEETENKLEENLEKMEELKKEDERVVQNDVKSSKKTPKKIRSERTHAKTYKRSVIRVDNSHAGIELDPIVKDNMFNLKMTSDLILWLIDLFLKGNVEEEHFNSLFDSYEYRLDQCLKRRDQMLESARYLEPLQKGLSKVMLQLSELEQKKIIGDISDEEYELKGPVFRWDINKFEREIAKSKSESSALEGLTQIITDEEINEMKLISENSKVGIKELLKSGKASQETAARIKKAMDKTLNAYMNTPKK